MRSDMGKLITECYRVGDTTPYRKQRRKSRQIPHENSPKRESIRKWAKMNWGGKELGEALNPLRRYILSQVGRPWRKVHSEMSSCIDRNSATQLHIWQHAVDYVEVNTYINADGEVAFIAHYGGGEHLIKNSYAVVYVDPKSGLLKEVPPRKRWRNRREAPKYIVVDDFHQLHKINGIWYEITLAALEEKIFVPFTPYQKKIMKLEGEGEWVSQARTVDVAAHAIVEKINRNYWRPAMTLSLRAYGREGVYGESKKQLNSKELRHHGLENDPVEIVQKKKVA